MKKLLCDASQVKSWTFASPVGELELTGCPNGVHELSLSGCKSDDMFQPDMRYCLYFVLLFLSLLFVHIVLTHQSPLMLIFLLCVQSFICFASSNTFDFSAKKYKSLKAVGQYTMLFWLLLIGLMHTSQRGKLLNCSLLLLFAT